MNMIFRFFAVQGLVFLGFAGPAFAHQIVGERIVHHHRQALIHEARASHASLKVNELQWQFDHLIEQMRQPVDVSVAKPQAIQRVATFPSNQPMTVLRFMEQERLSILRKTQEREWYLRQQVVQQRIEFMAAEKERIQSDRIRFELADRVHRSANVHHQGARHAWTRVSQTSGFFHPFRKARLRTEAERLSHQAAEATAAAQALDPHFSMSQSPRQL